MLSIIFALTSCYPTKSLKEGEYLFLKNKTKIKQGDFKENEISYYYRHKTNKTFFGVRSFLMWHNFVKRFNDSTQVGELAVVYDTSAVIETVSNIETYLSNEGYFNAKVIAKSSKGKWIRKRKTKITTYEIYLGEPYIIDDIALKIKEPVVKAFVLVDLSKSDIKKGKRFSVSKLKKERKRITSSMQNKGYYFFNEELITFDVDTNKTGSLLDLTFKVGQYKMRDKEKDTIISVPNRRYKVNNIYIYNDIEQSDIGKNTDTLIYTTVEYKDTTIYHFLYNEPLVVSAKAISRAIYIEQGIYKKSDATQTYKQLSNLGNFKGINIAFNDASTNKEGYGSLDCIIKLSRLPRLTTSTDFGAKNTGGDFGVELSGTISHRNLFKNAEAFSIQTHGAIEMRSSAASEQSSLAFFERFNTYEAGANMSLEIPRFLLPGGKKMFPRYFNPKTNFTVGYNAQNRTDFSRTIINGTFDYNWKPRISQRHTFPISLSAVNINPTSEFQETINSFNDARIRYSYQNHLVSGFSYIYTHNTQQKRSTNPYTYFHSKVEVGGLLFHGLHTAFDGPIDADEQRIIGALPYSNYIRAQADFRAYLPTGRNVMNVLRFYAGVGIPYWNSEALPFEKSFYTGGSNSLRGWILGTIGPGGYSDNTANFEKTGDMKLEFNYELRFPIAPDVEVGLFMDGGNIWLQKQNSTFENGHFELNTFIQQLYLDFGYGIRYDLSFLIIRLDMAHPMYQPYLTKGNRWSVKNQGSTEGVIAGYVSGSKNNTISKIGQYVPVINFAIGYPF